MSNKYVLLFLIVCAVVFSAAGQTKPRGNGKPTPTIDSLQPVPADTSLLPNPQDTTRQAAGRQSDINTTINYNARDSIRFDLSDRTVTMFGKAHTDYGQIKLEADYITTNWENNLLTAHGMPDSTGRIVGKPVFTDGPEQFVTDNIRYNFKTKKAIIKGIVTQQEEAYIHGETVKKSPDNELFISHARYTTCNLEHPHFHIEAERLKVLPNDKVVSGPFHLKIADVSTPIGFLFGMFPAPKKRTSGIIFPKYGEEQRRGFFLRDGGYYIALNEYVDLALTGEIYTRGSHGLQLASNYRKRYAYNGNFNIRYNRQQTGDEGLEDISRDVWVNWNHSPQTRGKGRFSASVNGGTRSYTTNNPSLRNMEQNLNQQFNSNISYSYNNIANSPFSFSSRASMNQDVERGTVDLMLPDISVMMNRQQPFKRDGGTGRTWYEQISIGYSFNATNRLSNKAVTNAGNFVNRGALADSIVPFNQENLPIIWDRARIGGRHNIPISTSFNVLKYFQVSPNFNYEEYWFLKRLNYTYDAERGGVAVDTVNGFSRAGVYNAGAGLSTKLFGTFYFNRRNPTPTIQAIRHMIVPRISFTYSPDFTGENYGIYQNVQTGVTAENLPIYQQMSVFNGFAYNVGGGREQRALSFGLTNNLEMKVRSKSDSVQQYKKISLLRNLSMNASYNFVAEQFKLSNISISGNTSLFENLISLNFNGTIDPYTYRLDSITYNTRGEAQVYQERVDSYAWQNNQGIGRLSNVGFGITTSLNPNTFNGRGTGNNTTTNTQNRTGLNAPTADSSIEEDLAYMYDDPNAYVDFNIPWTLRFTYQYNYSKVGFQESRVRQATNFSGDVKITDKWKVGFNSGYDIVNKQFTTTNLSIYRDLHCWQMNVNWSPFGYTQSFSVDINVKASILQDLRLTRRRAFYDN